jgi:hypothetical protein
MPVFCWPPGAVLSVAREVLGGLRVSHPAALTTVKAKNARLAIIVSSFFNLPSANII